MYQAAISRAIINTSNSNMQFPCLHDLENHLHRSGTFLITQHTLGLQTYSLVLIFANYRFGCHFVRLQYHVNLLNSFGCLSLVTKATIPLHGKAFIEFGIRETYSEFRMFVQDHIDTYALNN